MRLAENAQVVSGFVPVNMALGANNGDYVSLKNYKHLSIIFFKAAGTAGDDPTLTVQQATAVAGTGAKALNFTEVFHKQGAALTAVGQFTRVTQAAANTYTDATSAEIQAIWMVEIDADQLDVDGGFDCVNASVADVGTNSQIGALLYVLSEPRYAEEPALSAIVD